MPDPEPFTVSIGDDPLVCDSGVDAAILEPVGGILADGSAEGYPLEQLDQMVDTLGKYDRPAELSTLKKLIDERRAAER